MSQFRDTDAADAFVASADSRNTSREIMETIVFFARNESEAIALWEGDGFGKVAHLIDVWEHVTRNGLRDDKELMWGDRSLAQVMADFA